MRDRFPEYYAPGPEDEKRFISEATIVVDANVLLGLYRMPTVEREATLDVLEKLRDRLWIPYQVGLEYQRNRLPVISEQAGHYQGLVRLHGARSAEDLERVLDGLKVPQEVADEVRGMLHDLSGRLAEATQDYVQAVENIRDRHVVTPAEAHLNDPVRARLDELFDGRVGEQPEPKEHDKRIEEAERRAKAEVPPGYKDSKKDGEARKAGDYLVWAEILDHAAKTDTAFLFVTNDTKEDWYEKSGGDIVGPRPELVREFANQNSHGYHQVTLERLLRLANDHLGTRVNEATLEKASELSRPVVDVPRIVTPIDPKTLEAFSRLADSVRMNPEFERQMKELNETVRRAMLPNLPKFDFPTIDPKVFQALRDIERHGYLPPQRDEPYEEGGVDDEHGDGINGDAE